MNFYLVFDSTGDTIPFETKYNQDLMEWFINKSNQENCNEFFNRDLLDRDLDQHVNELHWSLTKTNEIYWLLSGENFPQYDELAEYLDQRTLNRQHALWVRSQSTMVDINEMRFSSDSRKSRIGWQLHELYPDNIRRIPIAQAMEKLGYIFPYEEVNMTVHRLEQDFVKDREYSAKNKWAGHGFDNPFVDTMISNMDRVNFAFGYTYVGRQIYNKWQYWDSDLQFDDHYNYEKLEWSFQLNLDRPQTLPWSPEFQSWAEVRQVPLIATQIPIANVIDLEEKLTHYRKMLYNNARQQNAARLFLN